jgi:hypothetical protein
VDVKDCATFRLSILRMTTTKNFKFDAQRVMCNEVKGLKRNRLGCKKRNTCDFILHSNHYDDGYEVLTAMRCDAN